jgi:hypothetical protein
VFSAAVSAMDPPKIGGNGFYGWLYRFTHLLAANLDRALTPGFRGEEPTTSSIPNEEKK